LLDSIWRNAKLAARLVDRTRDGPLVRRGRETRGASSTRLD